MIRTIIICASLFAITLAVSRHDGLCAQKKPHAVIKPAVWNFGKIKKGEKVTHVFTLKNTGNETLVVESAVETCECLNASFKSMKVKAGKSTTITVTYDTTEGDGPFESTVEILTNDPDISMLTIVIKGIIVE
jgi:hypothetical protein